MEHYNSYEYMYDYPSGGSSQGVLTMLMIYLIFILIVGIGSLAAFLLKGFGMYTMAKRCGMQYPWLAFVPYARTYLQGTMAGDIRLKKRTIKDTGIWLLVIPVMFGVIYGGVYLLLWIVGLGTIAASFTIYGSTHMGAGRITFLVLLILIFLLVAVAYRLFYKVFRALVNRQIYRHMTSDNMAVAHAMLGELFPLYEAVCFFVLRNKGGEAAPEENAAAEATESGAETAFGQEQNSSASEGNYPVPAAEEAQTPVSMIPKEIPLRESSETEENAAPEDNVAAEAEEVQTPPAADTEACVAETEEPTAAEEPKAEEPTETEEEPKTEI